MHVVAKKTGRASVESTRAFHQTIAIRFDFGDVVVRTDRDRAQRPRMRVGYALVVHRHVEEAGGTERLASWFDLLQVATKRLLALVEAEDCLESCGCVRRLWRVLRESVVQPMADGTLEGLVKNPASAHRVELLQFGFKRGYVPRRPLPDDRRVLAAELRHMEQQPRPFDDRCRACDRNLMLEPGTELP